MQSFQGDRVRWQDEKNPKRWYFGTVVTEGAISTVIDDRGRIVQLNGRALAEAQK